MAAMASVDWQELVVNGFPVPPDAPLDDLTAELTRMLGSPDPDQRDGIAFPTLATWIERGVYDDLLAGLGDGMTAGLTRGLGEQDTDTVFRRSFSALVLAVCLEHTNRHDLVGPDTILRWGDQLVTWWVRERGHPRSGVADGRGWAHAVAHGADAARRPGRVPAPGRQPSWRGARTRSASGCARSGVALGPR